MTQHFRELKRKDRRKLLRDGYGGLARVARKLDLSHSTVSRVANGKPTSFISKETTERVLDALDAEYAPILEARAREVAA
jgi:transcriptional regulator with XRE-family HTH domain